MLVGPATLLSACARTNATAWRRHDELAEVYAELLAALRTHGVQSVQIDEPVLAMPLGPVAQVVFESAVHTIRRAAGDQAVGRILAVAGLVSEPTTT